MFSRKPQRQAEKLRRQAEKKAMKLRRQTKKKAMEPRRQGEKRDMLLNFLKELTMRRQRVILGMKRNQPKALYHR